MIIKTAGGTIFSLQNGQVTITRSDQPECTIPLADIEEFAEWPDLIEDDDDLDIEEDPE